MLTDERGQAVSLTQPIFVEAVAKVLPSASDPTVSERMFVLRTLTYGCFFTDLGGWCLLIRSAVV